MTKSSLLRLSMTRSETACGWIYLIFEVCFLPVMLVLLNGLLPTPLDTGVLNFIYYCINFGAILVIFHRFLLKSLAAAGKNFWGFLQASVLGFVACWLANTGLTRLLGLLFPGFSNVNDAGIAVMAQQNLWLVAVGTVVLVPPVEETLFRGLLFRGLYEKNRAAAYLISACLFSAVHILGYLGSFDALTLALCFLQYIPAGLCLAWAYSKSGSIFASIVIHSAVNAICVYQLR